MAPIPPPARLPGPEHAARVAQLAALIERRHARAVTRLRRVLFDTTPLQDALLRAAPPGINVTSVVDPHGRLTVVASISELEQAHTGLPAGCSQVLVSIVGHHRLLDRRISVDPAEEEAWARLALGPWARHGYRQQQEAVTNVNGEFGAAFYLVFLDPDRNPATPPEKDPWPAALLPLAADTPGAQPASPERRADSASGSMSGAEPTHTRKAAMTNTPGEHPVQNGPVQSENIESASDRAAKDAAEHHTDHPTGETQAAENAETEPPG